jgi:hypothetical protein
LLLEIQNTALLGRRTTFSADGAVALGKESFIFSERINSTFSKNNLDK